MSLVTFTGSKVHSARGHYVFSRRCRRRATAAQRAIIRNPIQSRAAAATTTAHAAVPSASRPPPPPPFIPSVLLQGRDWTKQCWDAETNLELLNINSGPARRRIIMRG